MHENRETARLLATKVCVNTTAFGNQVAEQLV
jgi:hypothetical protein